MRFSIGCSVASGSTKNVQLDKSPDGVRTATTVVMVSDVLLSQLGRLVWALTIVAASCYRQRSGNQEPDGPRVFCTLARVALPHAWRTTCTDHIGHVRTGFWFVTKLDALVH